MLLPYGFSSFNSDTNKLSSCCFPSSVLVQLPPPQHYLSKAEIRQLINPLINNQKDDFHVHHRSEVCFTCRASVLCLYQGFLHCSSVQSRGGWSQPQPPQGSNPWIPPRKGYKISSTGCEPLARQNQGPASKWRQSFKEIRVLMQNSVL